MDTLLEDLLELTVEVKSGAMQQEFTDVGILEACDTTWLTLRKDNAQVMCFPIINVRNVRPVTPLSAFMQDERTR